MQRREAVFRGLRLAPVVRGRECERDSPDLILRILSHFVRETERGITPEFATMFYRTSYRRHKHISISMQRTPSGCAR